MSVHMSILKQIREQYSGLPLFVVHHSNIAHLPTAQQFGMSVRMSIHMSIHMSARMFTHMS